MEGIIWDILAEWGKDMIVGPILLWFMWYHKKAQDFNNTKLIAAIGKTTLSIPQAIEIARDKVKAASIDKLEFIRRRLEKNNLESRQDKIKEHIRGELRRISNNYISELNQYNVEGKVMLGEMVDQHFPFNEFMEEVYDTVFRHDISIERKLVDIQTTMLSYQNQAWEDIKIYLSKN